MPSLPTCKSLNFSHPICFRLGTNIWN